MLLQRLILAAGLLLIGIGLAANERVVGRVLSPDGTIGATSTRLKILLLELILITGGVTLVLLRRRLRITRAAALLLLFSTGVSLVGAELLLRVAGFRPWSVETRESKREPPGPFMRSHPELGYTHRPGRVQVTLDDGFTFHVTHDEDSWRLTHPPAEAGAEPRDELWIYGCSFTHGWSLSDEETYPWVLQELIPELEVRNFGVGGYGTLQSLALFRDRLRTLPPPRAVVVAYADFHDRRSVMSRLRRREVVPRNHLGPLTQLQARIAGTELQVETLPLEYREFPLQRYSALVAQVELAYSNLEERLLRPEEVTRAILRDFQRTAEAAGTPLLVAGIADNGATREMLEFTARSGMPSIDISVDQTLPENTNKPSDPHPSAAANRQYAERLHAFLRSELHLPPTSDPASEPTP